MLYLTAATLLAIGLLIAWRVATAASRRVSEYNAGCVFLVVLLGLMALEIALLIALTLGGMVRNIPFL